MYPHRHRTSYWNYYKEIRKRGGLSPNCSTTSFSNATRTDCSTSNSDHYLFIHSLKHHRNLLELFLSVAIAGSFFLGVLCLIENDFYLLWSGTQMFYLNDWLLFRESLRLDCGVGGCWYTLFLGGIPGLFCFQPFCLLSLYWDPEF